MTSQHLRREHAILRAQHERDALLSLVAEAELVPAVREALVYHVHQLHDAVHLVVTMGDETVYPALMSKVEGT